MTKDLLTESNTLSATKLAGYKLVVILLIFWVILSTILSFLFGYIMGYSYGYDDGEIDQLQYDIDEQRRTNWKG